MGQNGTEGMSDKIMGVLPHEFIRRMRNWAKANAGIGIGGVRAVDFGVDYGAGYREATFDISDGEVRDTESALAAVPMRYQQAVRQWWQYEGRSLRWHGRKRQVHHETFEAWVIRGHEDAQAELWRRSAAAGNMARANAAALAAHRALIAS